MIKRHPYICSTFEFYEDRFITVIVMEFLGGGDLFDRIVKLGKYTERDIDCDSDFWKLSGSSQSCIVHRDMKPENVLLRQQIVMLMMSRLRISVVR